MGTKRPVKKGILDSLGREIGYKQPEASAVEFDPEEYLSGMNDIYAEEKLAEESQDGEDFYSRPDDKELEEAKATFRKFMAEDSDKLRFIELKAITDAQSAIRKAIHDDIAGMLDNQPDEHLRITGAGSPESQVAVSQLWDAYQDFELPERLVDKAKVYWDESLLHVDKVLGHSNMFVDASNNLCLMAKSDIGKLGYSEDGFKESFQLLMRNTQSTVPLLMGGFNKYGSLKLVASEMDYFDGIHKKHTDEFNELNGEFDKLLASPDGQPTEEMAAQIYESAQKAIPAYSAYLSAKDKLENYLTAAATYASAVSERAYHTGFFNGPNIASIGELHSMRTASEGQKARWFSLDDRGISSSDMDILFSKPGQTKDEQLEKMWQERVNGAERSFERKTNADPEGREESWKGALGVMFSANNPEFMGKVTIADTYRSADGRTRVECDYLVTDGPGRPPSGIVNVSASTSPDKWGESGGGIDAIDQRHRAKVLSQMLETGVDTSYMAVMINGHDYRDYKITMTDELRAEAEENRRRARMIYDAMRQARELPNEERRKAPLAELKALTGQTVRSAPGDFPAAALTPGSNNQAKQAIFNHVAAATGESTAEVKQRFEEIMGPVESYRPPRGASAEEKHAAQDKVREGLRQLYRDIDFTERPVAALDITATSTSPTKARVLDLGLTVRDLKNDEVMGGLTMSFKIPYGNRTVPRVRKKIRESFSPTTASSPAAGTFNSSPLQQSIRKELLRTYRKDANDRSSEQVHPMIVSHKASIDRNLLRAQLKGFAEAEARGEVRIFDLSTFSRRDPEARSAISETKGDPYWKRRPHSSAEEAWETLNALKAYNDRFHGNG